MRFIKEKNFAEKRKEIICCSLMCKVVAQFFFSRKSVREISPFGPRKENNYKHQQESKKGKLVHFLVREGEKGSRVSWLPYLGQKNCVNGFQSKWKGESEEMFSVLLLSRTLADAAKWKESTENYKGKLMVRWGKIDVESFSTLLWDFPLISFLPFVSSRVAKVSSGYYFRRRPP